MSNCQLSKGSTNYGARRYGIESEQTNAGGIQESILANRLHCSWCKSGRENHSRWLANRLHCSWCKPGRGNYFRWSSFTLATVPDTQSQTMVGYQLTFEEVLGLRAQHYLMLPLGETIHHNMDYLICVFMEMWWKNVNLKSLMQLSLIQYQGTLNSEEEDPSPLRTLKRWQIDIFSKTQVTKNNIHSRILDKRSLILVRARIKLAYIVRTSWTTAQKTRDKLLVNKLKFRIKAI